MLKATGSAGCPPSPMPRKGKARQVTIGFLPGPVKDLITTGPSANLVRLNGTNLLDMIKCIIKRDPGDPS